MNFAWVRRTASEPSRWRWVAIVVIVLGTNMLGDGLWMVLDNRVIANQLPAGLTVASGSLSFHGTDLLSLPAAAGRLGDRIALIPQEPMRALNPSQTIGSHFAEATSPSVLGASAWQNPSDAA